jgi:hypothetical protein
VLKFFNAWGLVKEGNVQEGMRELEMLKVDSGIGGWWSIWYYWYIWYYYFGVLWYLFG